MPQFTEHNDVGNLGKTVFQVTQKQKGSVQVVLFSKNPETGEDGVWSLPYFWSCLLSWAEEDQPGLG